MFQNNGWERHLPSERTFKVWKRFKCLSESCMQGIRVERIVMMHGIGWTLELVDVSNKKYRKSLWKLILELIWKVIWMIGQYKNRIMRGKTIIERF